MNPKPTLWRLALAALLLLTINSWFSKANAQGTAFTYQGQLRNGTNAANGSYSFAFSLYNTNTGGSVIGTPVTNTGVSVSNGLFTVLVDFGPNAFTGTSNWLQIAVATNGLGSFTNLSPRQQVTPTPYSIFAEGANAAGLIGTISASNIANNSITSNLLAPGAVGSNQIASGLGLWSQLGSNLFYNGGNVGVGTNNPTAPLYVQGIGANGSATIVGVQSSGGFDGSAVYGLSLVPSGNGVIGEADTSGGGGTPIGVVGQTTATNGYGLYGAASATSGPAFGIVAANQSPGGAAIEAHNFSPGGAAGIFLGKVGIGTTNPVSELQVNGTVTATNFSGNGAGLTNINGAWSVNGGNLFFNSGSVGIGTSTTPRTLTVVGSGLSLNDTIRPSWMLSAEVGQTAGRGADGNSAFFYNSDGSSFWNGVMVGDNGTAGIVEAGTQIGDGAWVNRNLVLQWEGGNVGIGTTSPVTALQVNGTVTATSFSGNGSGLSNLPAMTIQQNSQGAPNVILGASVNNVSGGVVGATIAGGGATNYSGGFKVTNSVTAVFGTVGGGAANTAGGPFATVPGGQANTASGANSFAAGYDANATNDGAFVWADYTLASPFYSTNNNSFNVRASGGARFVTSGAGLRVDGPVTATGFSGNGSGLSNLNVSASQLTSIGNSGGGLANFFLGSAGNTVNSGSNNTANGFQALLNVGTVNVFNSGVFGSAQIGATNVGNNNTADGYQALYNDGYIYDYLSPIELSQVSAGDNNTASGYQALHNNGYLNLADVSILPQVSLGNNNTAFGYGALSNNGVLYLGGNLGSTPISAGNNNIALGYLAGTNIVSGNNNIDIGASGPSDESGIIRLGTPGVQTTTVLTGNVGIGLANPAYTLQVNGSVAGVGAYNNVSDARYKTNIVRLTHALDKIMAMRGVTYDWRTNAYPQMRFDDGTQLGFVAQEIKDVLPEVVTQDAQGYYSIAYSKVIPVLVEAVKEQQNEMENEQKTTQNELNEAMQAKDAEIQDLKQSVAELKKMVQSLAEKK